MTITAALNLVPTGFRVVLELRNDVYSCLLFEKETPVGGVTSSPPDFPAFERGVVDLIRARFDPTYDACEI